MKNRLLLLAVLSVAALPFLFSCNRDDGDNREDNTTIVMPEPASKDAALKIVFSATELPVYEDSKFIYEIKSIEFTESGRYLLTRVPVEAKSELGVEETIVGTYTENKGNYTCEGFGTVTVSNPPASGTTNTTVEVKPSGSENQDNQTTTTAKVSDTPSSSNTDESNLNRSWTVASVLLNVSGNGVNIKKGFTGCDLSEMAKYAAENGVSALRDKLGEFDGYKVKEIIFTGDKTVSITFTNSLAIKGTYSINTASKTLNLTLPEGGASSIPAARFFHGSVSGTYSFDTNTQMSFSLNTTIEGYAGSLEMVLNRVN